MSGKSVLVWERAEWQCRINHSLWSVIPSQVLTSVPMETRGGMYADQGRDLQVYYLNLPGSLPTCVNKTRMKLPSASSFSIPIWQWLGGPVVCMVQKHWVLQAKSKVQVRHHPSFTCVCPFEDNEHWLLWHYTVPSEVFTDIHGIIEKIPEGSWLNFYNVIIHKGIKYVNRRHLDGLQIYLHNRYLPVCLVLIPVLMCV